VAYLVNQYPAVSHTFIRREIQALERQGVEVERIALRGWDIPLVDADDVAERKKTRYVLQGGATALAAAVAATVIVAPGRFVGAWRLAWRMSRESERSFPVHLAYLAEACVILRWLAMSRATQLHAHFATNPAEVAMLVRALGGPPYSFTAHGSDIMDRPAQVGLRHTVGNAAFVVAVCSYGRSQIFKWIPHSLWSRVHVIRCGLQSGYGEGDARASTDEVKRLVCVGRLSKEKGQLLLIEAAARMAASSPGAFEIVLAGDGPMRQEIEALVARHGLGARVRITGWLDAAGVARELANATALVVPSLSEGLPVVIMEAMAHRRPVVAPYLAGIPELVAQGETGWLFPASDIDALSDAMLDCLATPEKAFAPMGAAAHRKVWAMHDVDTETKKLVELIQQAAQAA
jgi:glycosyltransferase involved in cell wall biosynthesis